MRSASAAREMLARATKSGAAHVVVGRELAWAHHLLDERRESLSAFPGVAGFGVGRVIRNGMPTGELCITVFVRRKLPAGELRKRRHRALPRTMSRGGRRIAVDIVEIGEVALQAFIGASVGGTNDARRREGTIGAFATDRSTGDIVAITAMHITGIDEFEAPPEGPEFSVPSPRKNDPGRQRLGVLTFGTRTGVDAAKIRLDSADDEDRFIPTIGEIRGWRPVAAPGDENLSVRLFGATSGPLTGTVIHPNVQLPEVGLDAAILVDIATTDGDSGAAIVDPQNHILGFLVGRFTEGPHRGLRIFTPAAAVVNVLDCEF